MTSSLQKAAYRPGFQQSETSRAELYAYTHGDDPVFRHPPQTLTFRGTGEQDGSFSLLSIETNKSLGSPAGTWTATVKQAAGQPPLDELILDDDWLDIAFTRWGEPYHVMRGLTETISRRVVVDGTGATTTAWDISGYDHGKVWMRTPVFFNKYIGENVGGGATLRAFFMSQGAFGSPDRVVDTFLRAFLQEFKDRGNVSWQLPPSMPGVFLDTDRFFANSYTYYTEDFTNTPKRLDYNAHMLDHQNSTLWDLATQWSDPQFCELYTELLDARTGRYPEPGKTLDIDETQMAVIFRDRPFPHQAGGRPAFASNWFDLPLYEVSLQDIRANNTSRSGTERKNAFFAQPIIGSESHGQQAQLAAPLWDREDIRRHGIRRMDYTSRYVAVDEDNLGLTTYQREQMRDWFGLNHYFYAGTLELGHSRPDIRVGTRLRIVGKSGEIDDETYYVEGVSHQWQYGSGARTALQVSRGWRGTDRSLMQAVGGLSNRYELALKAVPVVQNDTTAAFGGDLA